MEVLSFILTAGPKALQKASFCFLKVSAVAVVLVSNNSPLFQSFRALIILKSCLSWLIFAIFIASLALATSWISISVIRVLVDVLCSWSMRICLFLISRLAICCSSLPSFAALAYVGFLLTSPFSVHSYIILRSCFIVAISAAIGVSVTFIASSICSF